MEQRYVGRYNVRITHCYSSIIAISFSYGRDFYPSFIIVIGTLVKNLTMANQFINN